MAMAMMKMKKKTKKKGEISAECAKEKQLEVSWPSEQAAGSNAEAARVKGGISRELREYEEKIKGRLRGD